MKTSFVFTICLLPVLSIPCFAATIAVDTTADSIQVDGQCSLREAITAANLNTAVDTCPAGDKGDVIELPRGTYTLARPGGLEDNNATGDLDILADLSIVSATDFHRPVIDGAGLDRVFDVHPGVSFTLDGINVTGGETQTGDGSGGGIRSRGSVLLVDVIVSGCSAERGGGIAHLENGTLELDGSRVENNDASTEAGGVWDYQSYTRTVITDSSIAGNTADGHAGGMFTRSVHLVRSTVQDNIAAENGGGIYWPDDEAHISMLENSTVSGNQAGMNGGGMYCGGLGWQYLSNVTIAGNTADADGDDNGGGGGAYVPGSAQIRTRNSIIAANSDLSEGTSPEYSPDCVGALTSYGYNLVGEPDPAACTLSAATGDLVGSLGAPLDPDLGPLASNGGATQTMAPALTSPVLDAGDPSGCADHSGALLSTDQRGSSRAVDGPDADTDALCDIGAVELDGAETVEPTIFIDGFESGNTTDWSDSVS